MCFWKVKDGHLTILTDCPFSPILVLDIVESTSNLCHMAECMKYLQIIIQMISQNGLELDRKMIF